MSLKPTISELLALRDGEPVDAERAHALEADADVREALTALREIKQSMGDLPEVHPSPEVWQRIQERGIKASPRAPRSAWLDRFPMAAAASVFFAAVIGMLVWRPFDDGAGAPAVQPVQLGDLVSRSQQLESEVWVPVTNAPTTSESALFFRLADIDAELNALEPGRVAGTLSAEDERWRAALWERRVQLLEHLRTVQRVEQPEFRYAVY